MVQSTTNVYEIAYDSNVKREYLAKSTLRQYTYTKGNIAGDRIYFRKVGNIMATLHNAYSDMAYSDPGYDQIYADFKSYNAPMLIDKPQQHNFTFDEASIDAEISADAIARIVNQTILDALLKTTTDSFGKSTEKLTVDTLQAVKAQMDHLGIPGNERYFFHTSEQLKQLMSETKTTSSDYVNIKALIEGNLTHFLGFNFVLIPYMPEGGLPLKMDGSNPFDTGIIFHKRSIGFGVPKNNEISTSKDWLPTKNAWQVNATVSCGSVIIDKAGVIPLITLNKN